MAARIRELSCSRGADPMSAIHPCPACGTAMPPDAPEGLCPTCLMRAGLEESAGLAEVDADVPPTRDRKSVV